MPTVSPSQEELRNYFQNNRQYFDELAKYYRESDPDYYSKYIAPFYSNPFLASGSKKSSGGFLRIILSAAFLIVGLTAASVLFLMQNEESTDKQTTPKIQKEERKVLTPDSLKAIPEENPNIKKKRNK